ncbi:NAD+ kinase [Muriicola jejuensis]|uniref:NAD kinase n=1 Tax=Muriicola jejuensis TaxID=504488 RepID=A0A6P0UAA1_9FLAO|nr:NAD kinase [Muriicola jejuensis]NER09420.1 NAD kinase [Muriicola jejuensis]SMP08763.1 NAD+ kinase [Muriicola jejuensis]
MKVAIYGQAFQDNGLTYVFELLDELAKMEAEVVIEADFFDLLRTQQKEIQYPTFDHAEGLSSDFDLFVSFGGDGTILRAVTYVGDLGVPIVGVNTGRLGFLSTYKKEDVRQMVHQFLRGDYIIVERSLVSVEADPEIEEFKGLNYALNEVTVSRKDTTSMITIETHLNEEYLTSYWADGLIISTPTGSTGYSLSCGGPVMTPTAQSLVITPIAPHNLNARPLVISDDTEIRIKVSGREDQHMVSLDSRLASIDNGKELLIRKADFTIKMIEYASESFLKTIRNKLLWGQDKRN